MSKQDGVHAVVRWQTYSYISTISPSAPTTQQMLATNCATLAASRGIFVQRHDGVPGKAWPDNDLRSPSRSQGRVLTQRYQGTHGLTLKFAQHLAMEFAFRMDLLRDIQPYWMSDFRKGLWPRDKRWPWPCRKKSGARLTNDCHQRQTLLSQDAHGIFACFT